MMLLVLNEHRVSGSYVFLVVVVANNLHVVVTELDFDTLVGRGEETESVECKLELRTDADEDAALGLYTVLPAELQSQDVFVLVRLEREGKKEMSCMKRGDHIEERRQTV